jgi:Rieske Fe-S protein
VISRLALATALLLAAVAFVALAVNGHRRHEQPSVVGVDVHGLASGAVLTTRYTVTSGSLRHAPVFVARETDGNVVAFLGRSTHLGCKVVLADDPRSPQFTSSPRVAFVDLCGGSVWALDGDCVGGPCPRGLSTFPLAVTGNIAEIDLSRTLPGTPRRSA